MQLMQYDTLTNLIANLNTGTSKSVASRFVFNPLADEQIEAMYRGDWISRKVVELPVTDMLRPWRSWQATQGEIEAIEEAEKRHAVRAKIDEAMVASRLYGGAVIVIGADVGDPMRPLVPDAVRKGGLKYLTVLPRPLIAPQEIDFDPRSPTFGAPRAYTISSPTKGSVDIHPSRVLRFIGPRRPDLRSNPDGWGDSVLQVVYDAIHNAALSSTGVAELVHEAKLDIVRMPDLAATLTTDHGTSQITKRFQAANMLKSINNMLLLDIAEEHTRVATSFAGLPDIVATFMQIVAGAADIPVTRFLGTPPKGMNATGESDLVNYYDMLDGRRTTDLRPQLERLDEFLWRDVTGAPPPRGAFFSFGPLWQLSAKDKAAVDKTRAETAKIYVDMGIMPEEALAAGVVNGLIEDETYPGLEAEIEKYREANGGELVPVDEREEIETEHARLELQSARNGSKGEPEKQRRAATDRALRRVRDHFDRDADWMRQVYTRMDAGEPA